jgi:protease I
MARTAFLLAADYEDSEFRQPYEAVTAAGHEATVIGTKAGVELKGKRGDDRVKTELDTKSAKPGDYDALVIAGGYSPDKLRTDEHAVKFVKAMMAARKPVAAICHGPQLLIEADAVRGKTVTSWPSVKTDLKNAGARWVDQEVCVDENLITSRKPEDLEAFSAALLARLDEQATG